MCATIEFIIAQKNDVTKQDEERFKKLMNQLNFDADIITSRSLEEETKKQIERQKRFEREDPEGYQNFKMAYDSITAQELERASFTEEDNRYLLIHAYTRADQCLCGTTEKEIKYVLGKLLQEADELYYDANAERYGTNLNPFWKSTKTVSLTNDEHSFIPTMGTCERIKVV